MFVSFARQSVTRLRAKTKTVRGSEIFDWSNPDSLVISGCSVQPGTTELSQDGRVLGVLDGLTCYMPAGADVKEGDHIQYDGRTYEINGMPKVWQGVGNTSHTQLILRRWDG